MAEQPAATALPHGVWRRGPSDWGYRIEVEEVSEDTEELDAR